MPEKLEPRQRLEPCPDSRPGPSPCATWAVRSQWGLGHLCNLVSDPATSSCPVFGGYRESPGSCSQIPGAALEVPAGRSLKRLHPGSLGSCCSGTLPAGLLLPRGMGVGGGERLAASGQFSSLSFPFPFLFSYRHMLLYAHASKPAWGGGSSCSADGEMGPEVK